MALALVMCLTLCVPAFAAQVKPNDNRHQTVVVTDPNWTFVRSFTVTNKEAKTRTTLSNAIGLGLTAAGLYAPASVLAAIAGAAWTLGNMNDPSGEWGNYTVRKKDRITYSEDRITGERTVIKRQVLLQITLNQGGNVSVNEYTLNFK